MVDIHEKIFPPKSLGKPIMEPTGHTGRIVSAVIDENLTSHDLPKGFQWRRTITQNEKEHYYWLHLSNCTNYSRTADRGHGRLLRPRIKRPRRRAAEQRG
jgi:hypothetical protein